MAVSATVGLGPEPDRQYRRVLNVDYLRLEPGATERFISATKMGF